MIYEGHKVYMNGEYPAIFLDGQNKHIHNKDGNKMNWSIDNLSLLTRADHIREHAEVVHRKGVPVIAIKGDTVLSFSSMKKLLPGVVLIHVVFRGSSRACSGHLKAGHLGK